MDLFIHRRDVFAEQHEDGSYRPVRRPIEELDVEEHLGGLRSLGSYSIDPTDDTVGFAVFDLDTYDEKALEFLCKRVEGLCHDSGIGRVHYAPCLLLESSGGKGYHIWLFFDAPVPARDVRAWAAVVKEAYDEHRRPVDRGESDDCGEWPFLEIFPKQDTVPEGGFGNLVKLPLGVHAKSGRRSEVILNQGWANSVDSVQRFPSSLVPIAPEPVTRHGDAGRRAPFACITRIIEEGAPEGNRDNAMFHFARYAIGAGLPEELALEWCLRVNEEFDPPLTDFEVNQKVHSAAQMTAPHPGCGADWLKGFCPGGNSCFAPWNDRSTNDEPDGLRERLRRLRE